MNEKILVIGGCGFLGSHAVDRLIDEGFEVTVFDQSQPKYKNSKAAYIQANILNLEDVVKACKGVSKVFHFAGIIDIEDSMKVPEETIRVNTLGTLNVLQACRENNVEKLFFSSTVYVFSNTGSFYRVSKQMCEHLIESYCEEYKIDFTILRYGTLYGPRANKKNSIHRIVKEMVTEKKINYWGSGEEVRELVHIDDVCSSLIEIVKKDIKNTHILFTGQERFKTREIIELLVEVFDKDVSVTYNKTPSSHHYKYTPYKFKPVKSVKWQPQMYTDIGQGLLSLVEEEVGLTLED